MSIAGQSNEASHPRQNQLLAALPDADFERLLPDLRLEYLPLGRVIAGSGEAPRDAYFPTSAIVSLLTVLENGSSAEIAVTGRDGLVGVALFMGGVTTTTSAVVQSAGHAYRLDSEAMLREFVRGGALHRLLLRYMQALVTQMVQTAACNRHHTVEQQLCRWLLLSLDLLSSSQLKMTHDLIANMLGVRRAGVSLAAGKLQSAGIITYKRGTISVVSRKKLESSACECYGIVKREVLRLLPAPAVGKTRWQE